jgi:hypothetical protein
MRIINNLIWIPWALFVVSLLSPAVIVDMGAWNQSNAKPIPGWFCAAVAWPHYASNFMMLLVPVFFSILRGRSWARWPYITLAVLFFLSGVGALCWLPIFRSVYAGFVLWVASFFLASVAALLSLLARPFNRLNS